MAFTFQFAAPDAAELFPGGFRPNIRTAEVSAKVIDLDVMKSDFEKSRTGGGA